MYHGVSLEVGFRIYMDVLMQLLLGSAVVFWWPKCMIAPENGATLGSAGN